MNTCLPLLVYTKGFKSFPDEALIFHVIHLHVVVVPEVISQAGLKLLSMLIYPPLFFYLCIIITPHIDPDLLNIF